MVGETLLECILFTLIIGLTETFLKCEGSPLLPNETHWAWLRKVCKSLTPLAACQA